MNTGRTRMDNENRIRRNIHEGLPTQNTKGQGVAVLGVQPIVLDVEALSAAVDSASSLEVSSSYHHCLCWVHLERY